MKYSVVIPSKNPRNLVHCTAAIKNNERFLENDRIIIVDDGIPEEWGGDLRKFGITVVEGEKPFVFARNCNIGIRKAIEQGSDVVILLNDDAMLETPVGFTVLADCLDSNPEYGLIGATCRVVGNPNQFPQGVGLRDEDRMVCFVCVAIHRRTIEKVGLMDERYIHYGMDDDDYSFEVRKAGLKIGVHDGCVVDHGRLVSSFRGDPKTPSDFRQNMQIFIDKWGTDNWGLPAEQARRKWAVR